MLDEIMDTLNLVLKKVERVEKHLKLSEEARVIENVDYIVCSPGESGTVDIWEKVKSVIKSELTEIAYKTWILPLEVEKMYDNMIIFRTVNAFSAEILAERYSKLILSAFELCNKPIKNVKFVPKNSIM